MSSIIQNPTDNSVEPDQTNPLKINVKEVDAKAGQEIRLDGSSDPTDLIIDLSTGGTAGTNEILAGSGNNNIIGGFGADLLDGGDGNDTISGERGNDTIVGGLKDDSLLGGLGNDFVSGGFGKDFIDGGAGNDLLEGGTGNDTIQGGEGDDRIFGDNLNGAGPNGADLLEGGAGNDTIFGGGAADTLRGGTGTDVLVGGAGKDTFEFFAEDIETGITDTITDFTKGQDNISLKGIGAGANVQYDAATGELKVGTDVIAQLQTGLTLNITNTGDDWEIL